jgi:hypothetical protein
MDRGDCYFLAVGPEYLRRPVVRRPGLLLNAADLKNGKQLSRICLNNSLD